MQNIPAKALAYILIVYTFAVLVVVRVLWASAPRETGTWLATLVFLALALLAGSKKISLTNGKKGTGGMSMSLGFTVTFAALLYCGPAAGMMTGLVSCVVAGLRGSRQSAYQLLFNSSLSTVETFLAGYVFLALNGSHTQLVNHPLETIPALCASCLTYFFVNTVGVSIVIALCTNEEPLALWRRTFSWTAPSYFAGASVSAIAICICGAHVLYFALFLMPVVYLVYQSYATYRARAEEQQNHVEELQQRQAQLADLYLATIKSLALAIDAKDQYTHRHILRVQRYAVAIAVEMGLSGDELEGLTTGALLHDIGKLGVPEYVLLKPGRLTDDEFAKIKKHPEIGAAILDPVEFPWPVLPVVKSHHEKWDGTGYPEGLKGEEIPLTARILAAADVYDALTSTRSYRGAWEHSRAVERIREDAGTHFDPQVIEAFLKVIDTVVAEMAIEEQEKQLTEIPAAVDTERTVSPMAVREIQQASSELWALYEVAQSLSSSLGLDDTLNILARKLEAIARPGVACVFLLFDTEGGEALCARSAIGVNASFFRGSRTIGGNSLSIRTAAESKSYLGAYDMDDLLIVSSQDTQWQSLQSALIVPIVHEGAVLGTINMYHPEADAFADRDRNLLETIAERAAMAVYNGLMFDRTRSHAMTDPLTGLYNFRYLTQIIEELQQEKAPFALLCIDLDDFKPINDNFGHQKGDQVLRDLSGMLREAVRSTDIVARYGGDEFVIVVRNAGHERAKQIAQQIRASVEAYDPGLEHPKLGSLRIGASLGWSCYPEEGVDTTSLFSCADSAMYHDKTERKLRRLAGSGGTDILKAA